MNKSNQKHTDKISSQAAWQYCEIAVICWGSICVHNPDCTGL